MTTFGTRESGSASELTASIEPARWAPFLRDFAWTHLAQRVTVIECREGRRQPVVEGERLLGCSLLGGSVFATFARAGDQDGHRTICVRKPARIRLLVGLDGAQRGLDLDGDAALFLLRFPAPAGRDRLDERR